jgi:hypothetical protein
MNYCTVGSLQLCSSLELVLAPVGSSTGVSIRMRNLEGTLGTTPWAMANVGFSGLQTNLADFATLPWRTVTYSGTGGILVTADPTSVWCTTFGPCPNPNWDTQEWDAFSSSGIGSLYWNQGTPRANALVGCDAPPQSTNPNPAAGYFQTCGDGWVNVSFSLPGVWTLSDQSQVSLRGWTSDGTSVGCTFDAECTQVTPEPVSVILMGTGLGAVAALRRRRQRSQGRGAAAPAPQ